MLLQTGHMICDGGGTGDSANSARCTGDGVTIAGRVFFECRIDWEGDAIPDDHFCAALGGRGAYTARDLRDCT